MLHGSSAICDMYAELGTLSHIKPSLFQLSTVLIPLRNLQSVGYLAVYLQCQWLSSA